jgi:hypothetical protein
MPLHCAPQLFAQHWSMPLPICAPFGCCASQLEMQAATASPPVLEPLAPLDVLLVLPLVPELPLLPDVVVPELELEPLDPELEPRSPLEPVGSESPEQAVTDRTATERAKDRATNEATKARFGSMGGLRVRAREQPPYRSASLPVARKNQPFRA